MDEKKVPQQVQTTQSFPDLKAGYVPPKPPVTIAQIKPTSPPAPPSKETGKGGK
jgi:hypothetical protein